MVAERLRGPQTGVHARLNYQKQRVRDLYEFRHLVRYLASSALRVERVSFAFGFLWWLLDPLLQIVIWTVVIVDILGRGHALFGNYPFSLAIMTTMLPFMFFARTVRNSVAMLHYKELQMRRIAFPRAVFPLSNTIAESAKLLLAVAVIPIVALAWGESLSPVQLLVIPLMPILMAITVGLAWFFSALNFVFPDTERLLNVLLRLWMFISPIFYTLAFMRPHLRRLVELNPLSFVLECFRQVLLYHHIPSLTNIGGALIAAVVTLTVGFVVFHIYEPRFARLN